MFKTFLAKNKIKPDDADFFEAVLPLVHDEAKIPNEKRVKLQEIERTVIALSNIAQRIRAGRAFSVDDWAKIVNAHKRETMEVWDAAGKGGWFDEQHKIKLKVRQQFMEGVDSLLDQIKSFRKTNVHSLNDLDKNVEFGVRKINELATKLHLGESHYPRYLAERKSLGEHLHNMAIRTMN